MQEQSADKSGVILDVINHVGETDRSRVLMVGDTKYDMRGAKQIGVDGLGVLYGYGTAEELTGSGAKYIARTPQEIAAIVGAGK